MPLNRFIRMIRPPLMMKQPDQNEIDEAAGLLRAGGLVAMPTETVYGLAADATNDKAVARIFEAKGRPQFNPLIIHVGDIAMALLHVDLSPTAQKLVTAFWPGALTIVAPRRKDSEISLLASAGLDTLGVRCPKHPVARALIKSLGRPLAAPSANRSGSISPTQADHVRQSLGERVDAVLDGGPSEIGLESTIVKIEGEKIIILRPGGISTEELGNVTGQPVLTRAKGSSIEAPGMMKSHYAPSVRVRLNATTAEPHEAFLGFASVTVTAPTSLNLSPNGDLREAAANLFAYLHQLDARCRDEGLTGIAVAPIPQQGLGAAINDRLTRAAHPNR